MHDHSHHVGSPSAGKNLAMAFFLNLFFTAIELVGGLLTNSVAILSDALHDFGDSFSLGIAWYFQRLSKTHPTTTYTYGYRRFTLLSALINAVVLLTGSIFVLIESVKRVFEPAQTDAKGMLMLAVLGVIVNGFAAWRLKRGSSLNEKVVSLHLLEDVLGWVAVLIGSAVMLVTRVTWLDPVLSIGISLFVLFNVIRNTKSALRTLLQGKPDKVDEVRLKFMLLNLPSVRGLHDLHVWSLDNELIVLSVHLIVADDTEKKEQQALRQAAHESLRTKGIQHATIEIEFESEDCEWCERN